MHTTSCSGIIKVSYHALLFELLLIDIHRNSTRKGLSMKYVPVQRHRLMPVHYKEKFVSYINSRDKNFHAKNFGGSVPSTKYF